MEENKHNLSDKKIYHPDFTTLGKFLLSLITLPVLITYISLLPKMKDEYKLPFLLGALLIMAMILIIALVVRRSTKIIVEGKRLIIKRPFKSGKEIDLTNLSRAVLGFSKERSPVIRIVHSNGEEEVINIAFSSKRRMKIINEINLRRTSEGSL